MPVEPHSRARARSWVSFVIMLVAAAWVCDPSAAFAAPPDPEQSQEQLIPPKLLAPVTFEYPPELLEREHPPAGRITVEYVVGVDGVPTEISVLESPDPALDALGIATIARLRYEPASYAGELVEVKLSLGFDVTPPVAPPDELTPGPGSADDLEDPSDQPIRILGRIREAGFRTPVEGASVLAIPAGDLKVGEIRGALYEEPSDPEWAVQATTDAEGYYALRGVPDGKVRLIVLAPGYLRSDRVVELEPGKQLELTIWPQRESSNPYRTEVVSTREPMPEMVERSLSVEELKTVPGTQGDALKAIQNFPGVARAPFGSGLLAIRGAAPEDSAVFLGYHEIPLLFHFGGLRSVFASEILAQIDFIPGNFDSRYGDAIGGVVNVQPRKGRRDGYHGFIDVNAFDSGFLAEGPIGKGSFAVAGRRSYIDFVLPRVLPDDAGLNFSVAPRYWDYQILFDYPVSDGELSVRAFGSSDQLKLVFSGPNDDDQATEDARNQVETAQYFSRLDLVYRKRFGEWEFLVTPAYRPGFTELGIFGILDLDVRTNDISVRSELSRQISKRIRWRVGTEATASMFDINVSAPAIGFNAADAAVRQVAGTLFRGAVYSTATLAVSDKVALYPGVRVEWYAAPLNRAAVDPRLRGVWQIADKTALKAGVGLYSQGIQQPVQFDSVFGNPRLGLQRSVHTSLGVAQDLPWDSFIELTGFYKELWSLVSQSSALTIRDFGITPEDVGLPIGPENFASIGAGRIYGAEVLLRKALTRNLFGWVSYTLSRSTRVDSPGQPQRLFDFDQTHILTLIGSYKFKRGWQFGARFRLVSGNPYTAVQSGVFDAQTASYLPITGPINGDRLPAFHQLDLRLDKTWTKRFFQVTTYLDVQNAYNRQNVEFINYSYNFQAFSTINSLPIIPSIGLRLEL